MISCTESVCVVQVQGDVHTAARDEDGDRTPAASSREGQGQTDEGLRTVVGGSVLSYAGNIYNVPVKA